MTKQELEALRDRVVSMPLEERLAVPRLKASRADQLPAAAVIVSAVLDLLDVDRTVVSYWGLREGAILDAYGDTALAFGEALRPESVLRMERRFSPHSIHDAHVAALAASLFDQLDSMHHMDSVSRELLVHAARLHTIGMGVGFRGYHRHSAYLIENSELRGFEPTEIALLASIVRFHRRGVASTNYQPFQALDAGGQRRARQLAAMLHLADAADRGLDQSVSSIRLALQDDKVTATLEGAHPEVRRDWVASAEAAFWQVFQVHLAFDGVRIVDSF